jgi:hypothetical protein
VKEPPGATPGERCLASSVAKAMEDKCEADSGRHRSAVTFQQQSVKIAGARHAFVIHTRCCDTRKTRVATPIGLASEAALHGGGAYLRKSAFICGSLTPNVSMVPRANVA